MVAYAMGVATRVPRHAEERTWWRLGPLWVK